MWSYVYWKIAVYIVLDLYIMRGMKIIDVNGRERDAKEVLPDPDFAGYMKLQFRRHHEWMTIQEFVNKNPDLKDLTKKAKPAAEDTLGVATSATKTTLSDTKAKWKENDYLGFFVWIARGRGEGQKRTVVTNSHNKLTIDKPWETVPNKTSQYVISHNVKEVRAMGNTLPTEDIKELERKAAEMDIARGRVNKDLKYIEIVDGEEVKD